MPFCSIIPPHILRALARSGDRTLEDAARVTLERDAVLRRNRFGTEATEDSAARPRRRRRAVTEQPRPQRSVHDAQGRTTLPGTVVRGEGAEATGDPAVDEAYDGLGATWELWHTAYGRDSLDGKGLPLVATVHYAKDYDNAFWDGDQMVFGDGDGVIFQRFTRSLDVIGHELAHGVTQYTSGLVYRDQPGALNEHISDVFGVLVKQRQLGQSAAEAYWLIGAELLAEGVSGRALRSMAEPGTAYDDPRLGKDPQPGHMRDYVDTTQDHGGVHINSGIPNRAFYLVASALGGPAWERAGQIWVDAITGDISADCEFATFAALTIAAAERRYAVGSPEALAVAQGWAEVGVLDAPAPSPGPGQDVPPGSSTQVTVRRTGGFAGLVRERTVALEELPDKDARAWSTLLAGRSLHRAAARGEELTHPDAFCYGIECVHPPVDVSIPEPALSDRTRRLLDRTLEPPTEPPAKPDTPPQG